ncbi:ATP-binding cassette domain-containing protein [Bifidobacterium parmae]|uniref:ABC transporter ATP-binding protein n=1 Tax=Bifidobacterium parmae TaxID=361854 RepID=A0A2N5J0C1_9BIFI|nr:ATP-binding cassette domain-containing protein [Bifidobacterium parmae]PLS27658.1 ABC transporter ATP-binding protein [Bifidobacterium parmae]
MFDKRLFRMAPGIGRLVAGKVACMWVGLLANIAFVTAVVGLLAHLLHAATPGLIVCSTTPSGSACPVDELSISGATVTPLPGDVVFCTGVIVAAALVRYLTTAAAARLGTEASERVKLALRERLYRKMLAFGPSYAQRVKTADVVQSAGEGIEQIQSFFDLFLPQLFYAVLAPITLFCVVAPMNLPTAVTFLVCAPLIIVVVGMVAMSAARTFKKYWGRYTDMGAAFLDDLQGLETLKAFDADGRAARELDGKAENFRVMTMRVLQIQLRSLTAMDAVAYGGTAAGIGVALWRFSVGAPMTLASLLLIVLLSADFFIPLRQLGSFFHVAMNGMTSTKRIFALLDAPEPARGDADLPETRDAGLDVTFDHVAYAYGDGSGSAAGAAGDADADAAPALADVAFDVRPGELTAIVGVSGSGKSTAAALLAGTLAGYSGSLRLAGAEVATLSGETLSRAVTVIGARSHLFAGTLRENLAMALPKRIDDDAAADTDAMMWEALKRARIDDFVRAQADGLDMTIEQDAANLSGGQRQRIAIARALLHDAQVVVFDEATSSVDVESETLILDAIRDLAHRDGRTVVMITHRMANAEHADHIVVLDHGSSVEDGTHAELMAIDGGKYAKLFRTQADIERLGGDSEANEENKPPLTRGLSRNAGLGESAAPATPGQPADKPARPLSTFRTITRLLGEARPLARLMAAASLAGTIGHLAATMLPVFAMVGAFAIAGHSVWNMGVAPAVAAMIVCALLRGLMRYVEQYLNHNVAFRLLALFRSKAFAALRRLAPAKLAGHGKGDLIALVTTDVELLEIFFAHTISPVVIAAATTVVYTVLLLTLDPWMALALIVAHLVIGVLVPRFFATGVRNLGPTIRRQASSLDDVMLDDMRGLGEIIRFGRGEDRVAVIVRLTKRLWTEHVRLSRVNGRFAGIAGVLVLALTTAAAALAIALAAAAPLHGPALVVAFTLIASSFGPTMALSALPANLTQTFASARRLFALMDETPAVTETGTAAPRYEGMRLDHVTFAYPSSVSRPLPEPDGTASSRPLLEPEASSLLPLEGELSATRTEGVSADSAPVLADFSLDVPATGILGVQGPSGRGKSTTIKLLMRYWDPQAGRVTLSGTPLPDVDAHHRRRVQALMGQETHLFDGTIRDNLLLALPQGERGGCSATDGLLRDALAKASALDLVDSLPRGLDTPVGELGDRLSEGERQRIGLARVFLRDADLVLYDEPTSRLDALNEAVILRSIRDTSEGRAAVLVSHRESAMRIADRVVAF